MISDKGGWGVSQFLIFSDKGGRGVKPISDFWLTRGGGGVWTPPFLADIIYEQPLIDISKFTNIQFHARIGCRIVELCSPLFDVRVSTITITKTCGN